VDGQTVTRLAWMQGAFAELTLLCPQLAYDLAFVYIRQFAIHLRNAVIAKRKVPPFLI
jgi:hypothetical protein